MKKYILILIIGLSIIDSSQCQNRTTNAFYKSKGFYIFLNDKGLALLLYDNSWDLDVKYQYEISNDTIIVDGGLPFLQNNNCLCWYNWNKREFDKKHCLKLMSAKEVEKFNATHKKRLKDHKLRITNGILETIPDN